MPKKKTQSEKAKPSRRTKARKSVQKRTPVGTAPRRRSVKGKGPQLKVNVNVDKYAADVAKQVMDGVARTDQKAARSDARQLIRRLTLNETAEPLTIKDKFLFGHSCRLANTVLPGYSTLDEKHIASIEGLLARIRSYADDESFTRPLNFLMLASPGAGKSHFIDCVAEKLSSRGVTAITSNMACMSSSDDLIRPLDEARNAKVEDRLPLLFLDEFDSSASYYGLLLPLLWDGSLSLRQRDLKLGKIVIILAGSHPSLPETIRAAKNMASEVVVPEGVTRKLIDLLSRINGAVVEIPPFLAPAEGIDRRTDKVVIAAQLLKSRFGDNLHMVPLALLRMIAALDFRYGVRSIAHMIDLIRYRPSTETLSLTQLGLPMSSITALRKSSLAYHVIDNENQAHGIVSAWKNFTKCTELIPIQSRVDPRKLAASTTVSDFFLEIDIGLEIERITANSSKISSRRKKKRKGATH